MVYPVVYFITSLFAVILPVYVRPVEVSFAIVITLTGLPVYYCFIATQISNKWFHYFYGKWFPQTIRNFFLIVIHSTDLVFQLNCRVYVKSCSSLYLKTELVADYWRADSISFLKEHSSERVNGLLGLIVHKTKIINKEQGSNYSIRLTPSVTTARTTVNLNELSLQLYASTWLYSKSKGISILKWESMSEWPHVRCS